jgi:serine/threonine protein kinase
MGCTGSKAQHSQNGNAALAQQSRAIQSVVPSATQSSGTTNAHAAILSDSTNSNTSIFQQRTRLTTETSTETQRSGSLLKTTPVDFLLTDELALLTFAVYTAWTRAGIKGARMPGLPFMKRIGIGASFEVRLAEREGQNCAVKVIRQVNQERHSQQIRSVILEVMALSHAPIMAHKNIVKLIAVGWKPDDSDSNLRVPYLAMEYADQGTLNDLHKRMPLLGYGIRKQLCLDIAEGLKILHKCGVIHGDVKAENVLVFTDQQHGYIAKLGDFGCSIFEDERQQSLRMGGTYPWTAPEVKHGNVARELWKYTDIYSYGLLVWRLMLDKGRSPFDALNLQGTSEARHERIQHLKETNGELIELAINTLSNGENSDIRDSISSLRKVFQATLQPVPTQRNIESAMNALKGIPFPRQATINDDTHDLSLQLSWNSSYNPVSCLSSEN